MSLDIPKITASMRKSSGSYIKEVDFSKLKKVDFSSIDKVDLKPLKTTYPNPSTKKVNFLEWIKKFFIKK